MGSALQLELVIIDPQIDFCAPAGYLYPGHPGGSLLVAGAERSMEERLAGLVKRLNKKIDDIHVTLDSHRQFDVAHPMYWKNPSGQHPQPFTIISAADVRSGQWMPVIPSLYQRSLQYVEALDQGGRYPLCIWPDHCLIGSIGHAVMPRLQEMLHLWERDNLGMIDYVTKGSNPHTEHYSAVKAEVPDPKDPDTQINTRLIQTLEKADIVLLAGEAGSHCLANTVRDIADSFSDPRYVEKLVLLTDCTDPVTGFEHFQEQFIKDLTARGMKTTTSVDYLA